MRKYDQKKVIDGIQSQLLHEPDRETGSRVRLRPNELAEWELRIGDLRVFYDVLADELVVKIEAVGYKKGNLLFIEGEVYQL